MWKLNVCSKTPKLYSKPTFAVLKGKLIPTNPQGLLLSCADENEQNESKPMKPGLCQNSKQLMTELQLENVQY